MLGHAKDERLRDDGRTRKRWMLIRDGDFYNLPMSTLLFRNGRVIDPSQNLDRTTDLWVKDGKVLALNIEGPGKFEVSDAATLLAQAQK